MQPVTKSSILWLAVSVVISVFFLTSNASAEDLNAGAACSIDVYYSSILSLDNASREELQKLLEDTHLQQLPYTNTESDDVWKALQDLDSGEEPNTVKLIYSNKEVPSEPKGTGSTWNREHVWPKSHGVGSSGTDYTDVHHLFPADWGINSIRSNRFFDDCIDEEVCKIPDELTGTNDAPLYGAGVFQPPSTVRGDIARALFYMDLRYSHLHLTDCPSQEETTENESNNQMAYLSVLLEWHALDPPSISERSRNDRVCSRWQGNRNPFVDYPDLVNTIYGSANSSNDRSDEEDSQSLTSLPGPGDVMVIGLHTDNPDQVALVTLVDLPQGLTIHLTDNAYYEENAGSFATNEGTTSLTLSKTLKAGSVFGLGEDLLYGNSWVSDWDKGFALSASGDTIIVYVTTPSWDPNNGQNNNDDIRFLSAISFAGGSFVGKELCTSSSCGTKNSVLPASIADFVVELGSKDNFLYTGPTTGTNVSIQKEIMDVVGHWEGSNSRTDESVSINKWLTENPDGFVVQSGAGRLMNETYRLTSSSRNIFSSLSLFLFVGMLFLPALV